jgi:hypothetical protein
MGAITIYNSDLKGNWEKTGFWGNKDLGYESIRVKAFNVLKITEMIFKTALTQYLQE